LLITALKLWVYQLTTHSIKKTTLSRNDDEDTIKIYNTLCIYTQYIYFNIFDQRTAVPNFDELTPHHTWDPIDQSKMTHQF